MRNSQKPIALLLTSEALFSHFFPRENLKRLESVCDWSRSEGGTDSPELRRSIAGADALITTWHSPFLTLPMLGPSPRVRLIAHCGGEVKSRLEEAVVDLLTVTNAPDPMAFPVAEMALAMILSLVRKLPDYERGMRAGCMVDNSRVAQGETLRGRRIGIIGFGRIGRSIARLLQPFEVEILVADPHLAEGSTRGLGVRRVELEELLPSSSVVVLAAGLTPESRGMLNSRRLALLPDSAILVNVARGGLVEMGPLLTELQSGRISAAIDVTDPLEPLPPEHELRRLPNVLLTPHVAAGGIETRRAMGAAAVESVVEFFAGRKPANIVTRRMLATMT